MSRGAVASGEGRAETVNRGDGEVGKKDAEMGSMGEKTSPCITRSCQ
jgi:hypothetical protein